MAGIVKDDNGRWQIDRGFLTPERSAILDRLDEKHRGKKSKRNRR